MDMTQEQAVALVAYLNRAGMLQAMEGQAAVWRDALHGVNFRDAQDGCRALVRRPDAPRFVTPGILLQEVRRIRAARIAGRDAPAPPEALAWADDRRFKRVYLGALGDGASEADADAAACAAVGVVRPPAVESGQRPRLRELMSSACSMPEGD